MSLLRLVTNIDPARFRSVVISMTDEGALGSTFRDAGIPVQALGMRPGRFSLSGFVKLVSILRHLRPEVLQTWLYHSDLVGTVASRLASVPHLAWNVRSSMMDRRYRVGVNRLMLLLLARMSRVPDVIIANSLAGQTSHDAIGYRPNRWEIIPNGVDLAAFRPNPDAYAALRAELGLAEKDAIVGMVARYDAAKDYGNFLRAASRLCQQGVDAHFVAAGVGVGLDNPELGALVNECKLGHRLHLLGPRKDIAMVMAGFDIAVCASVSEGFPNVLVEALASAVPCVTTDVGDAAAIVGDAGIAVPPRSPEALAAGVRSMLDLAPYERRATGEAGRKRVEGEYSMDTMVRSYERVYQELSTA